jgi:hypothetical protein
MKRAGKELFPMGNYGFAIDPRWSCSIAITMLQVLGQAKPKPTKKGNSLSVEQFMRLSDLIKSDNVDEKLCKIA